VTWRCLASAACGTYSRIIFAWRGTTAQPKRPIKPIPGPGVCSVL